MLVLRLALRAMRWRAASAIAVFGVALVAVLAATIGPVYLHAVDERVLHAHVTDASDFQRDVAVTRTSAFGYGDVAWKAQVRSLATGYSKDPAFAAPAYAEQATVAYGRSPDQDHQGQLAAIDDVCVHLRIVAGRCVSGTSRRDAVISTRTAASEHLTVGDPVTTATEAGVPVRTLVVGIYRPAAPAGTYWSPWNFFQFGQPAPANGLPPTDAMFVTHAALAARVEQFGQTFGASVRLDPDRLSYDGIPRLRSTIATVQAQLVRLEGRASETGVPVASVETVLPTLLDSVERETSLARTLITVATAQLALLAIVVLYGVVAGTTAVQGPETALAKLRGRPTRSILAQGVAQPVLLVLLATPAGAVLAWLLVRLIAPRLLGGPVDVVFPASAYAVAAVAAAGGVLAAVVAARRIVVTPVGALLRRGTESASSSRVGLLVADAAAVVVAVAGLIELEAGGVLDAGSPDPLSALAPTLLSIAGAVVVLRLLPLFGRRVASWTRDSRRLATFLAVRQLLRRPAEARALLPVAVALAIAAFAVTNWYDAGHNRELRALNSAGADRVLLVTPAAGVHDLRTVVDAADPSGNAMAVAYTSLDQLPPLIAVDTSRFAKVGAWVDGNTAGSLRSALHRIRFAGVQPVSFTGSALRFTTDLTTHPEQPVHLLVSITQPDHRIFVRRAGPITPGRSVHTVALPNSCLQACSIKAVQLSANTPDDPYAGPQVSRIAASIAATYHAPGLWMPLTTFSDPRRWQGDGTGSATIGSASSALTVDVRQNSGSAPWPTIDSAAVPSAVRAVIASTTAGRFVGDQIHNAVAVGIDGQTVTIDGVVRSVTLPRVDRNGVMIDYGAALAVSAGAPANSTQFQVWLDPSAPADIRARLEHRHVRVTGEIRAASFRRRLDETGPAFADLLFLVAALAATVLAVGATAVGRVVSLRRRSFELAALEAVGVTSRTLRRSTAVEQGAVLAVGLVVGLATGLVGSHLALPSTPVFIGTSTGPPLVFGLPWLLIAALAAALGVLFVLVSLVVAVLVERTATPGQLRGAQQ